MDIYQTRNIGEGEGGERHRPIFCLQQTFFLNLHINTGLHIFAEHIKTESKNNEIIVKLKLY